MGDDKIFETTTGKCYYITNRRFFQINDKKYVIKAFDKNGIFFIYEAILTGFE